MKMETVIELVETDETTSFTTNNVEVEGSCDAMDDLVVSEVEVGVAKRTRKFPLMRC